MNKIISFLMVGLFFALFNVATVAADFPAPTGDDTHNTTGDGVALTIGDPLCAVAPALRDPGCPNAMPGTGASTAPPAGNGMNQMCGGVPCTAPPNPGGVPPTAPPAGNGMNQMCGGVPCTGGGSNQ